MYRVLQVFANLNLGGAESRMMDIYRKIDKDRIQFDFLILTDERCHFENEILALGGHIYRATHPSKNLCKHIIDLARIIKNNNFQAIHSHTSYLSGLVVLLGRLLGVQFLVCHARNQSVGKISWKSKPLLLIGRLLCNIFSTSRLAISNNAGKFLFGKNNLFEVIPNSFDFSAVKIEKTGLLFKRIESENKVLNLVMVARLEKVKNHEFALDLMRVLVKKSKKNVCLHLIGSGTEEKKIRSTLRNSSIEKNVVFWGERNDVKDILCEFDCLILPSHHEGLGVAVLEGQAAGLQCIVSNGIPAEADIGLGLVKRVPLDVEKWANIIMEIDNVPSADKQAINMQFKKLGYEIDRTTTIYLSKYGIKS